MRHDTVTIIELTDSHAKCFQSKSVAGKRVITYCQIKPHEALTDEDLAKVLKEVIPPKKIDTQGLIAIIPRRFVILKQMRLPSLDEAEIRKMAGLQLVNEIPYGIDDVIFDYHVLEKDPSGYSQVLVVIVHKDVTSRYIQIFNKLGINPEKLTFSSLGLLGWFSLYRQSKKIESQEAIALLSMDYTFSEICLCQDEKLFYSRNINFGVRDLNDEHLADFLKQIKLTLETYSKENMGLTARKIFILSALEETMRFAERIKTELKMAVEVVSPWDGMPFFKNVYPAMRAEEKAVSSAVGLGAVFSDSRHFINLTPEELYSFKKTQLRRRQWVNLIILIAMAVLLSLSWGGMDWYKKFVSLNELKEQVKISQAKIKEAKKKIQFVNLLDDKFKKRIFVADVIAQLYDLTPSDISFGSLHLDESGQFAIQGYAEASTSVNVFQANLVKSELFKDVNLQFATKRKIFNMEVTDFKIAAGLKNADAKEREKP